MIYPTRRAILLAFLGAPLSLVAGLAAPDFWFLGVAWLLLVAVSLCADAMLGGLWSEMKLQQELPAGLAIGTSGEARFHATFALDEVYRRAVPSSRWIRTRCSAPSPIGATCGSCRAAARRASG